MIKTVRPLSLTAVIFRSLSAILLALLTLPTAFLLLPIIVLPALSMAIGGQTLRRCIRQKSPFFYKLVSAVPIPVAIWMFFISWHLVSTGYKA